MKAFSTKQGFNSPSFIGVAKKFKEMEWKVVNLSRSVTYDGQTTMENCFIARKAWQIPEYSKRIFTADVIYHANVIYCFLEVHDPIFLGSICLDSRFNGFLEKVDSFFEKVVAEPIVVTRAGPRNDRYVRQIRYRPPGLVCDFFEDFQDKWNLHTGTVETFRFPVLNTYLAYL